MSLTNNKKTNPAQNIFCLKLTEPNLTKKNMAIEIQMKEIKNIHKPKNKLKHRRKSTRLRKRPV